MAPKLWVLAGLLSASKAWSPRVPRPKRAAAAASSCRVRVAAATAVPAPLDAKHSPAHASSLAPGDAWIRRVDLDALRDDVRALSKELAAAQGPEDLRHLERMCRWSNACGTVGVLSLCSSPNPVTACALSLWSFSRWAVVAHHTCHGGYNTCDPSKYFHSSHFAVGSLWRRATQWFDWMLPEAWNTEHNNLHHYRLNEDGDPDLVERNLDFVRTADMPKAVKYLGVLFLMCTWKWFYYAPNTFKELAIAEKRRRGEVVTVAMGSRKEFTLKYFVEPEAMHNGVAKFYRFRDFWGRVMGPFVVGRFLVLPTFAALGTAALGVALGAAPVKSTVLLQHALVNLIIADVLTNIHAFVAIMPNHCGSDLYSYEERSCAPNSGTFFLRQIISSANFRTGGDKTDFLHGWLNYGIEHHLMPQLSALSYRKAHPRVKELCRKHGIPYVQEPVFTRLRKTVAVMVGDASMRKFPKELERAADLMVWSADREESNARASVANEPWSMEAGQALKSKEQGGGAAAAGGAR